MDARSPSEVDSAFSAMTRQNVGAVLLQGSNMQFIHRAVIAGHAVKRRLPTMGNGREYVEAGCLMSYFPSFADLMRRAAYFVDRIMKGAKTADLPVEQATRFELSINLKTAKALGMSIPQSLATAGGSGDSMTDRSWQFPTCGPAAEPSFDLLHRAQDVPLAVAERLGWRGRHYRLAGLLANEPGCTCTCRWSR